MPRRKSDPAMAFLLDSRLHELSALQSKILLCVMSLLAASPTPGRVSFLRSVAASVSRWVSVSEPIAETETETHLRAFEALNLIRVDWAGSAIVLPGQDERDARAERARINGKNGGRPLKGESHEAYLARKQGHLALPIEGGKSETQKTQNEPTRESSRAVVPTTSQREVSNTAREAPAWVSLGQELAEIAGMDATNGRWDCRPVQAWLSQGHSAETIRRAVREVAGRRGYDGRRVFTFRFFDAAVQQQAQRRASEASGADALMQRMAEDAWHAELTTWAMNPKGPRPVRPAA